MRYVQGRQQALTDDGFWNGLYRQRGTAKELQVDGFRNRATRVVLERIERLGLDNKQVLEIGGGDSAWLPYLARKYPRSRFAALDYSSEGCARLRRRLAAGGIGNVEVHEGDFTRETAGLKGAFDVVLSFGVVEHFRDLQYALLAKTQFSKPGGFLFTLIPNYAGVCGWLARRWNPVVFGAHNPHDWGSFVEGHGRAGLEIVDGGYLVTTEFGVLSMCFLHGDRTSRTDRLAYLWLTRLSKTLHFVEDHFAGLPATALFSPYIYAASRFPLGSTP
jgi:SAM-dependent methyltransferase